MIITIISIVVLTFLSGIFNGRMDYIKKHNLDSESWKEKWGWISNLSGKYLKDYSSKWYYFGLFKPEHAERFPYSSTILVFLTDEWHLKKWQMFLSYEIIISVGYVYYEHLQWWFIPIGIIALKTIRGLGFTLKYDKK